MLDRAASSIAVKADDRDAALKALGISEACTAPSGLAVHSPIDGSLLATVATDTPASIDAKIARSAAAFAEWRTLPAPRRGEFVRLLGEALRSAKADLAALVTLEAGKITTEALGEVQEMIDICDFAVGLSRQLHGLTIQSERPEHKMAEVWHPMGPVGVISAFNFPVAVWAWNAALALVCGDSVIWKPSEKTPLVAFACARLFAQAAAAFGGVPDGLLEVLIGDRAAGEQLVADPRVPIISATGSSAMGRIVGARVADRFGRAILELGGNNAMIVAPSADLSLAIPAILFGAVGTCGQRCTSTRRLFVHGDIYDEVIDRLHRSYATLAIGDPREEGTLVGPLIDGGAYRIMQSVLDDARGKAVRVVGGERMYGEVGEAFYVRPAIVEFGDDISNVQEETFAPILSVFRYTDLADAIARNNAVPQGLSSSIFTNDVREAELFTAAVGSDCGIANVNLGTSGAEIGGAFGGEKATGGGRESGSDAWRGYMRRQTQTTNYGATLPLAQGVKF
ncbi:L-piperidine-6-carboxylate dehydrogenase [Allosphingosinicella indica]|uniref:aldehyde dehydrogenase (NAD(+)) n=1 Tax=Allosphingosinicella indica TaxID=941907 RepID=A0A1X7GJ37_9SPHN|nr:aldehyde dehydrogenase family protein [Allosphingosinicella indica]SMF70457.1 aldehyde dehydrogenase (NAD+) [Allosphingosinicella indica]